MKTETRLTAAMVFATAALTGIVFARGADAPAQGQTPPPPPPPAQGQTQPPPTAGRGEPGRGAGPAQGQGRGGRRGGFPQYTRELAPEEMLIRGKALYETNCASCHMADLRGTVDGKNPNLLRSGVALRDLKGELIGAAIAQHKPPINLIAADSVAVAEYIHSVHGTMGGQGSPPGRNPTNVVLNVLVGDAKSGETYFAAACSKCHSVTGDLKGIGAKYPDARALQNAWVAGSSGRFGGGGGGGRGGGGGAGNPVTVTMADGSKLEGTLVRKTEWLVVLTLADGTRKSMARNNGVPRVDVKDPQEAHKKMVLELDDAQNKKMHDVTAYLWTIK
jgi:cytochrome c oxidase cbb3-type subunit III